MPTDKRLSAIVDHIPLFIRAIAADLLSGKLTLWAGSMVYTTLLSLVPLMAVSFSLLKAFGVHNQLEPLLLEFLTPLGEQGVTITNNVIDFVDRVQVGVLGAVGVGFLFVTVVLMIAKIEDGLNEQWQTVDSRPWHRRISYYLSALMLAPLLAFSAFSFLGSLFSSQLAQDVLSPGLLGTLFDKISLLVPMAVTVATFTLVYLFLPYTTVRLINAFKGALFSTITWKLSGWIFSIMIARATHYDAIYSGFTIMIVLVMWLYLTWLIFILGARISFYFQQPHAMIYAGKPYPRSDNMLLSLNLMHSIGRHFKDGTPGPNRAELSLQFQQNDHLVNDLLGRLKKAKLINQLTNERFAPARALDSISLFDIIDAVNDEQNNTNLPNCEVLQQTREQNASNYQQQLGQMSLNQWLQQTEAHKNTTD